MKNIKIWIALFAISLSLNGQKVYITGQIKNSKSDSIKIYLNDNLGKQRTIKTKIKNGLFSMSFEITQPTPAFLNTNEGNLEMFILPNDTLTINYDDNKVIQSIIYEGTRKNEYQYFIEYRKAFNLPYAMFTMPDWSDVFGMNPNEFKKFRKDKVKTDLDFFNNYCSRINISNEFKIYAKAEIEYSYYYALLSYSSLRNYFKKIHDTLPADFYDDITLQIFQFHKYIVSKNYVNTLRMYVSNKVGEDKSTNEFYPLALSIAQKTFKDSSLFCIETLLIKDMFSSDIKINIRDSICTVFLKTCTIPHYLDIVNSLYKLNKRKKNAEFPNEVLATKIINLKGEEMTFKDLLKFNKGKVLYIDFWASYCGPCKIEMPYSNQLRQKLSTNKHINIIYLSLDEDINSWQKAIKDLNIDGDNFRIKDGIKSRLCQYLNMVGIPHYALVNVDGKIVLPSAGQPSSKNTETSIKELLK